MLTFRLKLLLIRTLTFRRQYFAWDEQAERVTKISTPESVTDAALHKDILQSIVRSHRDNSKASDHPETDYKNYI